MGILGPVVVEATGGVADDFIRALALELATSAGWTGFRLMLCGFGGELTRFPHVDLLTFDQLAALGDEHGPGSLRLPTVLLCSAETPDGALDAVLRRASDPASFLTVVGFDSIEAGNRRIGEWPTRPGDTSALRITRPSIEEVSFGPGALALFGAVLQPQLVTSEEVSSVIALVESCRPGPLAIIHHEKSGSDGPTDGGRHQGDRSTPEVSGVLPDQSVRDAERGGSQTVLALRERGGEGSLTMAVRKADCEFSTLSECEIEVAVLGPVEIRGADRPFTRAWSKELVVYLAVHPAGASNESWATALWPNHLMAPSSLHSTVSVARRSLGQAVDGTDHLPRSHGRLMLGPSVSTDWARFLALTESETADSWREALGLVRGRPFEGLRDADWSVLDGTAPLIESTVVEVSGRLAGTCFREGDTNGMEWAARKGLLVSPYDERLYRMLLRAADLAGNPAGVESVMAELVKVVADEREPLASIHPSTLALYRQLSRRPATGAVGRS
jgi:DNA-binding SARP family transcriptional activator